MGVAVRSLLMTGEPNELPCLLLLSATPQGLLLWLNSWHAKSVRLLPLNIHDRCAASVGPIPAG